jgi:hypothetical protein
MLPENQSRIIALVPNQTKHIQALLEARLHCRSILSKECSNYYLLRVDDWIKKYNTTSNRPTKDFQGLKCPNLPNRPTRKVMNKKTGGISARSAGADFQIRNAALSARTQNADFS